MQQQVFFLLIVNTVHLIFSCYSSQCCFCFICPHSMMISIICRSHYRLPGNGETKNTDQCRTLLHKIYVALLTLLYHFYKKPLLHMTIYNSMSHLPDVAWSSKHGYLCSVAKNILETFWAVI